ncbi:carboxyl-terminal processing protease [Hymenobacter daecheongensis DSM 21074]|uniref:Carboxyl-terminal processing protease n=1 Tax=Hymenobacter daecheongensis DSM 21074 TaxID=1121955 RepID=A0A1M6G9W3_9BACT|nr:carboxy terminal-processing peptidase [Hymenobacter daecheongensis]SHJ06719.1 carboxyl-terminal processing protease [Hymenobacter daecheongensis DSM 21074]
MSSPRLKIGLYASLVLVVFVLASYKLYRRNDSSGSPQKDEVLIKAMLQGLSAAHYQPEKIDDNFSKRVFDLGLKRLDYNKKFLLQSDVEQLRKYQFDVDDQVRRGTHELLDLSTKLILQRTDDVQALYRDLLSKPFDFSVQESFETEPDKMVFAANAAAQREDWRKYLKYQTLIRMSEIMDEQAKKKDKPLASVSAKPSASVISASVLTPTEIEAEARKRVLKYFDDQFKDLKQTDANERLATYADVIANTYDPHTQYFAPRDKEAFDQAMTGRFEGIGATLQEKDGQIKVADIVPGSASYRQGELKAGDIILRVAQGAEEPVSVEGWRLDKAIVLIRGKKGTEVRLTVKKPDASTKIIPIIRDVVVIEETFAKSAIVNEGGKKIGYLRLPSFYADFNDNGGRSSADDVKKELEKLTKENVQGVVLDLRFNGGGSLQDAVDMTGLFVDSGPVVQVRSGQGSPSILNDRDPRVQYSGPLVVLVNKYSASASEILAAAIQDYKRGVIVGSASTYGKGTVQRVVDLDDMLSDFGSLKPFGSLKLTTQKFYRINGGSTQFKGVVPDIILPDAYSYLDQGERESDYPLKWDEITPARYRAWNNSPGYDKLRTASQSRVASSPSFKLMNEMVQRMRKRKDDTMVSLNLAKFRVEQEQAKAESAKYEAVQKATTPLDIAPLMADVRQLGTDTVQVNRASRFTKNLKKDITLHEAISVIKDQL